MSIYNKTPLRQWGESDTISTMRFGLTCFMFFSLLCVAQARHFDVPTLPASTRPGTEVSTNIHYNATGRNVLGYDVELNVTGSASNCVEVAFGRDEDGDGELALGETGLAFGWRGGDCFLYRPDERWREPAAWTNGVSRKLAFKVSANPEGVVGSVGFSFGGVPVLSDVTGATPAWAYAPDWNMLRVTRRGVDAANESVGVDADLRGTVMRVR